MARAKYRDHTRVGKTDAALAKMAPEQLTPYPSEWWAAEATRLHGKPCPRCGGLTTGQYIAPRSTMGDCGIVQACMLCGWERLVTWGRWGIPYGQGGL